MSGAQGQRRTCSAIAMVVLLGCALAFLALAWAAVREVLEWREANRGIAYGAPPAAPQAYVLPWGVNVALEQYEADEELDQALELIEQAGFHWLRQRFPWLEIEPQPREYRWDVWDRIVEAADAHDLGLIAVLERSPEWARAEADRDNPFAPPKEFEPYASFAGEFARRYGDTIDYYQVWDQPNIAPHWGARDVDPEAYVDLLKASWAELKSNDVRALVLAGGLAPNLESWGLNMSELQFLRRMYEAGAGQYFDVLAAKPYGFWSGPDDRRVDGGVLNYSRLILLRDEMESHGDADKAIWAVELGWNALPDGWQGSPSPWGADSEQKQAGRTLGALRRAREEWPWLGAACLQHFQPKAPLDDPIWGFSLVDQSLEPRLLYWLLRDELQDWPALFPGRYPGSSLTVGERDGWKVVGEDLVSQTPSATLEVPFWGTRADLLVKARSGVLQMWTDEALEDADASVKEVDLSGLPEGESTIVAAQGLPASDHVLRIRAVGPPQGEVVIRSLAVHREPSFTTHRTRLRLLGLATLAAALAGAGLWFRLVSAGCCTLVSDWYLGRSEPVQWIVVISTVLVYYFVPWLPLALLACAILVGSFYLRGDIALVSIAAAAPFAVYARPIGPMRFTLVEVLTLIALVAYSMRWIRDGGPEIRGAIRRDGVRVVVLRILRQLTHLDWAVVFFAAVSLLSLGASTNLKVSLRELRTVVAEPVVIYLLIRSGCPDRRKLLWLVDALVVAGLVLSLHGLYQYAFTDDVIVAEGVRRVRGIYGSPNNMGLLLGRIIPLAVAMGWGGHSKERRWFYRCACVPIVVCLFLTFSRGAWLLGVPAALVFLGLLRGRRTLVPMLVLISVGLLALIPLAGTERLASTFEYESGTGFLRLRLWESAWHMIRDHPLSGIGLDNFLYLYEDYILPGAEIEPDLSHPHNIVLDFWTRLGILGVVALVWLLAAFFRKGMRIRSRIAGCEEGALVEGLMASMVAIVAHGLVDNAYFAIELAFVFFVLLGSMSALDCGVQRGRNEQGSPVTH